MLQKRPALVQSLVHHAHSEILGLTSGSLILTGLYMYVWGGYGWWPPCYPMYNIVLWLWAVSRVAPIRPVQIYKKAGLISPQLHHHATRTHKRGAEGWQIVLHDLCCLLPQAARVEMSMYVNIH